MLPGAALCLRSLILVFGLPANQALPAESGSTTRPASRTAPDSEDPTGSGCAGRNRRPDNGPRGRAHCRYGPAREEGNIGISGHRDGFFRGLKDIREGDGIELVTATGTDTYTIDHIVIVKPTDVSVLAPRPRPSITLVTCYPFYFVGSAPQRYIVQASMNPSDPRRH